MRYFENSIVYCSTSIIFYIVLWKNSLSSVDVDMISQTMLKPQASLYELFIIFLFLNYYHLYQNFRVFIYIYLHTLHTTYIVNTSLFSHLQEPGGLQFFSYFPQCYGFDL